MKYWPWFLMGGGLLALLINNRKKMNLTPNFSVWEFASKDGAPFPLEVLRNLKKLAQELEVIRAEVGKPIIINSGYRSPEHNAKVGGVKDSMHLTGKAADIKVIGVNSIDLAKIIEKLISQGKLKNGGLGVYPNFIHYDIRNNPARW